MGRYTIVAATAFIALGLGFWLTRAGGSDFTANSDVKTQTGPAMVEVAVPENLSSNASIGKLAFDAKCAVCHGSNAAGREGTAPPLIHKIYEPSHHGDASFQRAVKQGVRAHHWRFGNMPPVGGLTEGDVKMIIAYVRELQRENGIK